MRVWKIDFLGISAINVDDRFEARLGADYPQSDFPFDRTRPNVAISVGRGIKVPSRGKQAGCLQSRHAERGSVATVCEISIRRGEQCLETSAVGALLEVDRVHRVILAQSVEVDAI